MPALTRAVEELHTALLAMLDVHTAGRGLASYGVHSFTQLAAILLMPVLLFIVCDQFTKPTRRS